MEPEATEKSPNPLPAWLSIPIILICLTGGGWIIHWYVMTDPVSHESTILGDPPTQAQFVPAQGGGARNRAPVQRRTILDRTQGRYELRTEQARADVSVLKGKTTIHTITYTGNYSFVPDETKKTLFSARTLISDATRTTALKLTPQQINKLRGLSWNVTMVVKPEDRDLIGSQIAEYAAADEKSRPAIEAKVLKTMDDVADRSTDATKKQAMDHADQINQIITPDMWKQNAAMGGAGAATGK